MRKIIQNSRSRTSTKLHLCWDKDLSQLAPLAPLRGEGPGVRGSSFEFLTNLHTGHQIPTNDDLGWLGRLRNFARRSRCQGTPNRNVYRVRDELDVTVTEEHIHAASVLAASGDASLLLRHVKAIPLVSVGAK